MTSAEILAAALTRWRLANPVLVTETPRSFIYRVDRPDIGSAALKLLKPDAKDDEARGGRLLAWYGGNGAAIVHDVADDAVLMQWLGGGSLGDLARNGDDETASVVLVDIAANLHGHRATAPPPLTPLDQRFASLFDTNPTGWSAGARSLVSEAGQIARDLLDHQHPAVPLHGDLHHDNIMRAGSGWAAIDPKGLLGDPAYEYVNSFQNPERAEGLVLQPDRIAKHAAILAARCGIDRRRLLGWAVAHCALSGAWHVEDGSSPLHQERMLALLLPAYRAG